MNMNGLINMVVRLFARKAMRHMTQTTTRPGSRAPNAAGTGSASAGQREAARRARQAARMARRLGR